MTRAYWGMVTMAMANRVFLRPGPSTKTIAMARINDGNPRTTSMIRISVLSVQPPT